MVVKENFSRVKDTYNFVPVEGSGDSPIMGVKVDGDVAYVSGNVAFSNGELQYAGRIGDTVTIEDGKKSAALSTVNCLQALENAVGLENVKTILKVTGYLCCTEDVTEQPEIMNASSQVLIDVFGEAGKHARAALGIHTLPLGASTEVELIAKLK